MALATFSNLKDAIAAWTNRSDLTTPIPDFIKQAEATLNRVLRTRYMIADVNVDITTGADRVALPSDLLDILFVSTNGALTETLVKQVPDYIANQQRLRQKTAGVPLYYAVIGTNMLVCPIPSANRTFKISYYQEIPTLSDSNTSNWLLTHHPDLYLYTSLMHAYPFLADEDRATVMGNQMVQMVQTLVNMNKTTTLEGEAFDVSKG